MKGNMKPTKVLIQFKHPETGEIMTREIAPDHHGEVTTLPTRRKQIRRDTTVTIRSFGEFCDRLDQVWEEKGFRSRTHYVCSLIAKDMKWKGPY
jgi:hypothetical protein